MGMNTGYQTLIDILLTKYSVTLISTQSPIQSHGITSTPTETKTSQFYPDFSIPLPEYQTSAASWDDHEGNSRVGLSYPYGVSPGNQVQVGNQRFVFQAAYVHHLLLG
jgi:hypothetical protein